MKAPTYGKRGGLQSFDRGSRNVSHAYGKATVLTHGLKANGGIALESESERLVSHILNLDPAVVGYAAQPFAVELTTGSIASSHEEMDTLRNRAKRYGTKTVFYTPDFGVDWSCGVKSAVEVKLVGFCGNAEYQRKLKVAADILCGHGYEFLQLVMPYDWRHPLRTNLPLLHQASLRQDMWPKPGISDRIAKLHHAGAATMGDYLHGLQLDARMSPLLLVSGHLAADIVDKSLCFATATAPAHGDLSHLQLVRRLAQ